MADQLTATGLEIDDLETRTNDHITAVRLGTGLPNLDCSVSTSTGQIIRIGVEHDQQLAELIQETYSAIDPDQATGQSLAGVASITGTYRQDATSGTVALTLTFTAGPTTVPAGSIVAVAGDPDNQWIIDADVVHPGPGAGVQPGTATASQPGPITAVLGTITVIVTPVANWSAVDNAAAAVPGAEIETDTALRLRREIETTIGGSTSVDAIRAAVSQITGVLEAFCYENDLHVSVAPMPPHSVEVVYWSGATLPAAALVAEIAEAIWTEKAGGIRAYGSDTDGTGTLAETVTDSQGNPHRIGFTRAAQQRILVEVTAVLDSTYTLGAIPLVVAARSNAQAVWTTLDQYLRARALDTEWKTGSALGIGDDVFRAWVTETCMGVIGVTNITQVRTAIFPAALANVDLAIGQRQIATIAAGDVTVV